MYLHPPHPPVECRILNLLDLRVKLAEAEHYEFKSCLSQTWTMIVHVVLHNGILIGLYSCGCDAAEMAKRLPESTVVQCHLNASTEEGSVMLAAPA